MAMRGSPCPPEFREEVLGIAGESLAGTTTPLASDGQSFVLPPGLVQGTVNDPASNQGIILADAANTDGMSFHSRESSEASQRPRLTVTLDATFSP